MIKLIASDMDGTLLNSKNLISDNNLQAILEAQRNGIQFMVATGRGYKEARPVLDKFGIECPMITVNGAQAFDKEGELLFTIGIPKQKVAKIMSILDKNNLYFEVCTNKGVFSNSAAKRLENTANAIERHQDSADFKLALAMSAAHMSLLEVTFIDNYDILLDDSDLIILKLIVFAEGGQAVLKPIAQEINQLDELAVTSSFPTNIEINHQNAQKGIALKRFAKTLGISMDETMTFGDNLNDLSMLEIAKYGTAMGNAEEIVKQTAKYVTATNDKSGVALGIIKALNNQL